MSVHSFYLMMIKNNKKELIINAAIRIFAQKGFYTATVADVAKEAGVADGTIYLYFKNKDDLLISLFETKMEEILQRFSYLLESDQKADDKLRKFIQLYFKMIQEDRELAEVFQVELRQSSKFLKDYHNQNFIDFLNLIGDIIHQGQVDGTFRTDIRIHSMKLIIFGALDELARQWILSDDHYENLKKTADEMSHVFLRSLSI
jgi:TetR/AcrR family transcriptional regulator, fatty acid metabolism regulator protein